MQHCFVSLQGRLSSANVGDSGYLVLGRTLEKREFHVKYRSPQQEHNFGVPYQLGHEDKSDTPADAMLMTLPVRPPISMLSAWFMMTPACCIGNFCHLESQLRCCCAQGCKKATIHKGCRAALLMTVICAIGWRR